MKKAAAKRTAAALLGILLLTAMSTFPGISAANTEETPGLQLQTILADNDGKNEWLTESWRGANILLNTSWTTLSLGDYYENGVLDFDVHDTGSGSATFKIGLISRLHGETVRLFWNDLPEYKTLTAGTEVKHYTLPIKALADSAPDSGFTLDSLWYISVSAVTEGHTLSFENVKISSPDDERQYPFIKVNQAGYFPNGKKPFFVSCFAKFGSLCGKTFEVVNAETGQTAYTGTLPDSAADDALSGESLLAANFDELTAPGTYFIRIQKAGLDAAARSPRDIADGLRTDEIVSPVFTVGAECMHGLLNDVVKYYYYQRQGIDLEETYAGVFARQNLHPDDSAVRRWSDRDNPDAETFDVSQGWYDAGDYGKYTTPAAHSADDLLIAAEFFSDGLFGVKPDIPETDPENVRYADAPALLSEVKWELDMMRKLEHSSHDGSFYVAANYKDGVIYLEDTLKPTDTFQSGAGHCDLRSHMATASAAAVFAHAYLVYRDVPVYAEYAEECLALAKHAFAWATDSANEQHPSIGAANRTYTFSSEELSRELYWAAGTLFRACRTAGESSAVYEQYIIDNSSAEAITACFTGASTSYNHKGRSFLGYFHYLYGNGKPDAGVQKLFQERFASWRTRTLKYSSWGTAFPEWGYWWGSNIGVALSPVTLTLGSMLIEGDDRIPAGVQGAVQGAFNYLLGVNPLAFSYVSGHGENCVRNIYSAIYSKDAKTEPYQCPAGYVTEGTNYYDNRNLSKFNGKCYIDSDGEWTTNENTIYANAAMTALTAAMIHQQCTAVSGDLNADGQCSIADAVLLAKYLCAVPGTVLKDWAAGDFDLNGRLNAADFTLLKRRLLS